MAYAIMLILIVAGTPIAAAVATIALLDWLAPRRDPKYWPFLAAWWFPLLLLAYGIHLSRGSQCDANGECGGLGEALLQLLGMASVLTGLLLGPFAAWLALRYLRKT